MIVNVHERRLPPDAEAGRLLDGLASPGDALWPARAWPPLVLDAPLGVGAAGGHGRVRYHVQGYLPGRRVVFRFDPGLGVEGTHTLELDEDPGGRVLRHRIEAAARGSMRLLWPLAVRWLHDALIEDLLDRAELAVTGRVAQPARWSPWVRALRRSLARGGPRVTAVPVPAGALVLRAMAEADYADAFAVELPAGAPADLGAWAEAVLSRAPGWVVALMRLRDALVAPLGLRSSTDAPGGQAGTFPLLASGPGEWVLGADDRHLDFRVGVQVLRPGRGRVLVVSTLVRFHNPVGRAYFLAVRPFHRRIVPALMRRAVAVTAVAGAPPALRPRASAPR